MPILYKNQILSRSALFAAVPGLEVAEALFAGAATQMFCIKNNRLQYVSVNDAFVARSRVSGRAAVLGRTAREIFPPRLAAGYELQDDAVLTQGRTLSDKLEMITNSDGTAGWYLTQKQPVRDSAVRVIAIASVSTDLHAPVADDPRLGALAGAIEQIRRDYQQPLRITALAEAAGMSLSQFERRTRDVLRLSPRRLLTRMRVEAAAQMLRETREPLDAVAQHCGFYDQAQFSRQFRALTGLTPSQYRKS
jgi:AraC-like DNA-binding protein